MFDLKKDIQKALKKYPDLILDQKNVAISGKFIAYEKASGTEIEEYEILIRFNKQYPFCFPVVEETSRRIPRDISRHIQPEGNICFGNPQDELALCRNGISLIYFLDEVLNSHLCREYAREKLGYYPTGERSHGNEGIWEGYYEVFNTNNKKAILNELEMIHHHPKIGRNSLCYCKSGKKYKACHEKTEPEVLKVGRDIALKLFELLKTDFQKK